MLDSLPAPALIAADAGFISYELANAILANGRELLIRVGSNVRLLKKLGYARESDDIVYLWPNKAGAEASTAVATSSGGQSQRQTPGLPSDQYSVIDAAQRPPSHRVVRPALGDRSFLSEFEADLPTTKASELDGGAGPDRIGVVADRLMGHVALCVGAYPMGRSSAQAIELCEIAPGFSTHAPRLPTSRGAKRDVA